MKDMTSSAARRGVVRRPAAIAAFVNGLVVLVAPSALLRILWLIQPASNGVTVHGDDWSPVRAALRAILFELAVMSPVAIVAVWRTYVYAVAVLERRSTGWLAVVEGVACAVAVMFVYLVPGIIGHPLQAPYYVAGYCSIAAGIGLLVALPLRLIALLVLRASADPPLTVPLLPRL